VELWRVCLVESLSLVRQSAVLISQSFPSMVV